MAATLPAAGSFLSNASDNVSKGPQFEAWLERTKRLPGGNAANVATISNGLATITSATPLVDTEGQTATDNLDRIAIADWELGAVAFVRSRDPGREVVARHGQGGAGQLLLDGNANVFLDNPSITLILIRESDYWKQAGILFGTQSGQARAKLGLAAGATMPVASQAEAAAGSPLDTRIITPATLNYVLNNYPALFARMGTKTTAAAGGDELIFGTSDGSNDVVRKGSLSDCLPFLFKTHFYSGEVTCNPGDTGNVPHNLGGRADLIQARLLCKTAQHGYAAGDDVNVDTVFAANDTRGIAVGTNPTSLYWKVRNTENIAILSFAGSYQVITPANWRLTIRAWRAG